MAMNWVRLRIAAVVTADAASRDSGQNAHEGGLGTGRVEIIDDEHIRDGSILPRFFVANTGTRNRYDSRLHAPDPRAQSIQPAAETTAAVTPRSTTADVQIMSPYINGNDEICIPEVYCKKRGAWGYVWVGVMYQY